MCDVRLYNIKWIYLLVLACFASFVFAIPVFADYYEWQAHTGYISLRSAINNSYLRVDSSLTVNSELSLGVAHVPVVSTDAGVVTDTGATFQGTLSSMGGFASSQVWFDYGYTASYGSSTVHNTVFSTGSFTQDITLSTGVWHYRSVSLNTEGIAYGADQVVTLAMDSRPSDVRTNPTILQISFLAMMVILTLKGIVQTDLDMKSKLLALVVLAVMVIIGFTLLPLMFIN